MPRDATTIERELNSARIAFNMSRAVLADKLLDFDAREGTQDRLIYFADAYGTDHVLETMAKDPLALDMTRAASADEVAQLRADLQKAYEDCHRVDRLMAERENLLRQADPTRPKAIIIGGREVEYDGATARFRDTDETVPLAHETVHTSESGLEDEDERTP